MIRGVNELVLLGEVNPQLQAVRFLIVAGDLAMHDTATSGHPLRTYMREQIRKSSAYDASIKVLLKERYLQIACRDGTLVTHEVFVKEHAFGVREHV